MTEETIAENKRTPNQSIALIAGLALIALAVIFGFWYLGGTQPKEVAQPSCDTNTTNAMLYYSIMQDTNQHSQLAQLIIESNYRMSCIIDQNSLQKIEIPQGNGTYSKAIKSTWYCPQGG